MIVLLLLLRAGATRLGGGVVRPVLEAPGEAKERLMGVSLLLDMIERQKVWSQVEACWFVVVCCVGVLDIVLDGGSLVSLLFEKWVCILVVIWIYFNFKNMRIFKHFRFGSRVGRTLSADVASRAPIRVI